MLHFTYWISVSYWGRLRFPKLWVIPHHTTYEDILERVSAGGVEVVQS